jgi:hypothetical protein
MLLTANQQIWTFATVNTVNRPRNIVAVNPVIKNRNILTVEPQIKAYSTVHVPAPAPAPPAQPQLPTSELLQRLEILQLEQQLRRSQL